MASLLDMRRRIKSVKNTQQITKAMKMLSAAKLKRAQDMVTAARPFAGKMTEVLNNLASRTDDDFSHPLLDVRGDEKYLLIVITGDKGLAGGFNANLIKAAQNFVQENAEKQIEILPIGRKGRDYFRRRGSEFAQEYVGLTGAGRIEYSQAAEVAREVIKRFSEDETLDKVFLVYSEFKSVLAQKPLLEQILPVTKTKDEVEAGTNQPRDLTDYIYEQPPTEIFSQLLPQLIETIIYRALLESIASEHGARMTAMDAATKNASELISNLTLTMNRKRQAAITNEIIEIVSGASAL